LARQQRRLCGLAGVERRYVDSGYLLVACGAERALALLDNASWHPLG